MKAVTTKHLRILRATLCCTVALCLGSVQADPPREVKDPHYGEVLFDFFQNNYFSGLSHLMASQHFERMSGHVNEAELLRGGMLLSYGLHDEAGKIFQAFIDQGAPPAMRDRAWFFLAKIRYQRGYMDEAEAAMSHIGAPLPADLEDERRVLHAFMLSRKGQHVQAMALLRQLPEKSDWAAYGRFNLGVALVQQGEREAGLKLLNELGENTKATSEEAKSLRDKANVALAYTLLQNNDPVHAVLYLERVRINGLMSNKALLGMGWAYSALDRNEQALTPWVELSRRSTIDSAVQESLLATPYAFGKLGAFKQSLQYYERALTLYTSEQARLDESVAAIRAGKLTDNILRDNPGKESGWFWRIDRLPNTPESRYLSELIAGHDFQEGLKNYRDLRFLSENLKTWLARMQAYRDMLITRQQRYAQQLPRVLAGERVLQFSRVRETHARDKAEFERIEQATDADALANDREQALRQRLERVRAGLARLDPEQRAVAEAKYRLLNGLLLMDLSAQYPARLWDVKKALQETDLLVEQMDAHRDELKRVQDEAPANFASFQNRIDAARTRMVTLNAQVDGLLGAQEQYLANLAIEELTRRREQIAVYVTQARFAVAQIYDEAVRATQEAKAP